MIPSENRCSFPREPVNACGVRLLTMWRVRAGAEYRRVSARSRHDSQSLLGQAGKNIVAVRTDAGEGVIVAKGRRHLLRRGSLLLFDFPSLEEYRTLGARWDFWWVELVAQEPLHLPTHQVWEVPMLKGENSRCEEVFSKLSAERIETRCLAAATWQALFFGWCDMINTARHANSRDETGVHLLLEALKRQPSRPWTFEDMAMASGMSPTTLRAACHKVLGKTPARIRNQLKLCHAYEHLRRGDLNVAEVAESLGFCDPFHFSKAFKKEFGYSPSAIQRHPTM
ncbi:MAG: AraC family transcriptional regulator [Verrucomicrobiota bacterium]